MLQKKPWHPPLTPQASPVRKRFLFALNQNLFQFFFCFFRFVFQLYLVQVFNIFLIKRTNCCCTTFQHLAEACLEVHLASAAGNLPQFRLQFQFINANLLQLALGNCSRKWRPTPRKKLSVISFGGWKVFNLSRAYYQLAALLRIGVEVIKNFCEPIRNAKLCAN